MVQTRVSFSKVLLKYAKVTMFKVDAERRGGREEKEKGKERKEHREEKERKGKNGRKGRKGEWRENGK